MKRSRASRMTLEAKPGPDGTWRVIGLVIQARERTGMPPIGGYHHSDVIIDEFFKIDFDDIRRRWFEDFQKAMRNYD